VQTPATFDGSHVRVDVGFTNVEPNPVTANFQVRIYDKATGQLLSFATEMYTIVVKGNGVYNIPAGQSITYPVKVDLPPGHSPDSVRIEGVVETGPEFTG